jgi:hypothetical protein
MNRKLSLIITAAAALAACNSEPEVVGGQPDPMKDELAKAAPVELPPAIAASKTYRCKDNGLVTVDWLQGGKGANLRVADATTPVQLKLPEAVEGQPASTDLAADGGYALKGAASATSVTLTLPGKGAQVCHV